MYVAGQWIVNLNYWGCNQYITQRALGADLTNCPYRYFICGLIKIDDAADCDASRVLLHMYSIKQGHLAPLERNG